MSNSSVLAFIEEHLARAAIPPAEQVYAEVAAARALAIEQNNAALVATCTSIAGAVGLSGSQVRVYLRELRASGRVATFTRRQTTYYVPTEK